jgi:maleamate amidohydrolase
VDALQHGYRPIVPREAVGDRNPDAHAANLFDLDAKYADVVSLAEVIEHLEERRKLAAASVRSSVTA